jgi:hypothetical protein
MENNGAVSIELSSDELTAIEKASSQIKIIGNRYTDAMEQSTGL